jgi:phage shock protein A
MSLIKKFFTLGKATVTDAGEAVIDANAIKILRQEIRDAETSIRDSENSLTKIMADKKIAEGELNGIQVEFDKWMANARQSLEKGDEALAGECASKAAESQDLLAAKKAEVEAHANNVTMLENSLRESRAQVKALNSRIKQIEATEKVQKAQSQLSKHSDGAKGKVSTALDSLDRIEAKQKHRQAQLEATKELNTDPDAALKKKLDAAGIGTQSAKANDLLAQLKAEK